MGSHGGAPCAACRILRRKCDSKCLLAPYFPSHEADKFIGVHRVFGASNVIKMIQMVEEGEREDAVKAMVYEARARLRDPVYGSAGAIYQLQKMIKDLKAELDSINTHVSALQQQKEYLLSIRINNNNNYCDPLLTVNNPMISDAFNSTLSADFDCSIAPYPFEFPLEPDSLCIV